LWHGPAAATVGPGLAATIGGVLVIVFALAVVRRFPMFWTYRAPG
ncbi:MAG: MFS transporter, partial [Pseudonocardia sp.]|nr:MFS transporter [Pseudonocardia sp.]